MFDLMLVSVLMLLGRYVWQPVWGPAYRNSFIICIMSGACAICLAYILRLRLAAMNQKLHNEEVARGDKIPGFRYML